MNIKRKRTIGTVISLASMADIAFLLLIFFIVTSTIEKKTPEGVRLPVAEGAERLERDLPFALVIRKDGRLSHEGRVYSPFDLGTLLQMQRKDGKGVVRVMISGDRDLAYGRLSPYIDVLKRNGVHHLVFVANYGKGEQ